MAAPLTRPAAPADVSVLDNPAWSALTGAHAHLAIGSDRVKHYPADVSPFVGIKDWQDPGVFDAITEVFGHGAEVSIAHTDPELPEGWEWTYRIPGVQLVQTDRLHTAPDAEAVVLGAADVPDMLALIERSRPGPFEARTHELGRYIGIRREGRLIAMAGERLHAQGWTEISAVTVDPEHRRQGLASRLVLDVAFHIQERGDRVFLHTAAENTGAIATYEGLGFELRRTLVFAGVRTA